MKGILEDLTGKKFARLLVIEQSNPHIYSNGRKEIVKMKIFLNG